MPDILFVPKVIISLDAEHDRLLDYVRSSLSKSPIARFVRFYLSGDVSALEESEIYESVQNMDSKNSGFLLAPDMGQEFVFEVFIIGSKPEEFRAHFEKIEKATKIPIGRAQVYYFLISGAEQIGGDQLPAKVDLIHITRTLSNGVKLTEEGQKKKVGDLLLLLCTAELVPSQIRRDIFAVGQPIAANVHSVVNPPARILQYARNMLVWRLFEYLTRSIIEIPMADADIKGYTQFVKQERYLNSPLKVSLLNWRRRRAEIFGKWKKATEGIIVEHTIIQMNGAKNAVEELIGNKAAYKSMVKNTLENLFMQTGSIQSIVNYLERLNKEIIKKEELPFNWYFFRDECLQDLKFPNHPWTKTGAILLCGTLATGAAMGSILGLLVPAAITVLGLNILFWRWYVKMKSRACEKLAERLRETRLEMISVNADNYFKSEFLMRLRLLRNDILSKWEFYQNLLNNYRSRAEKARKTAEAGGSEGLDPSCPGLGHAISTYVDERSKEIIERFSKANAATIWKEIDSSPAIEELFDDFLSNDDFYSNMMDYARTHVADFDDFAELREFYRLDDADKIICFPDNIQFRNHWLFDPVNGRTAEGFDRCLKGRLYIKNRWFYLVTAENRH